MILVERVELSGSSAERQWRHGADCVAVETAFVVATLAAVIPVVVAAGRAVARGWLPVGDDAYTAIRGRDVFDGHAPLLGTWSSASLWSHHQINHPGPLQFNVAAVPVRLFGPGAGVAVATAAVNVVAVLVVAWLARWLLGALPATLTMLFTAGLILTMGSELLFDPWSQYAPVLPFLAFLFAVWAAASGRATAWPVLAVAGSYVLQTHLSYALLVPALAGWALVARLLAFRASTRAAIPSLGAGRRGELKWAGAALVCAVICWAQPVYQQLTGRVGNLSELGRSVLADGPPTPGPQGALQAVGNIVALPPFWLPPSWVRPHFGFGYPARPLLVVGVALTAVAALGVVLGSVARRAGDRTSVIGLVTVVFAVGLAFLSVAQARSAFGLITASYVRWLWPISLLAWTALAGTAVRALQRTPWLRAGRRRTSSIAVGLAALAVVVSALAVRTADHGTASAPWAVGATRTLSRQTIPRLRGRGSVLVRMQAVPVGPALLFELQRHGIDFVVDDKDLISQLGPDRAFDGTNARVLVDVVQNATALHPPRGFQRIAYAPALDRGERRLVRKLSSQVSTRIRALHAVPLDERALDRLPVPFRGPARVAARRAASGDQSALRDLVKLRVVDASRFGTVDINRWAELLEKAATQASAVLEGPLPSR